MVAQNEPKEPQAPDFGEDFDDFDEKVTEDQADFDAEETNAKEVAQ